LFLFAPELECPFRVKVILGVLVAVPVLVTIQYPLFNGVAIVTQPDSKGRPEPELTVEAVYKRDNEVIPGVADQTKEAGLYAEAEPIG